MKWYTILAVECTAATLVLREAMIYCGANTGSTVVSVCAGIFMFILAAETRKCQ